MRRLCVRQTFRVCAVCLSPPGVSKESDPWAQKVQTLLIDDIDSSEAEGTEGGAPGRRMMGWMLAVRMESTRILVTAPGVTSPCRPPPAGLQ